MPTAPATEKADTLHYAPPPPLRHRPVTRRAVIFLLVASAAAVPLSRLPALWWRLNLLIPQRRCLQHVVPPETVVLEPDPHRAAELLKRPGYLPWIDRKTAYLTAPEWERYYAALVPNSGVRSAGTVFLGGRTSPAGGERLVAVDISASPQLRYLSARVIEPGGVFHPPRLRGMHDGYLKLENDVRVFAGQRDPADASHFTIACEAGTCRRTIDGWLRNDTVRLEWREP